VSVAVSNENARKNHLHGLTHFGGQQWLPVASGACMRTLRSDVANVLARPLVKMAPDLAAIHLCPVA